MNKKVFKEEVAVISAKDIDESLTKTERQYIQGNLKKEQILPYVFSDDSEIGISYYKDYTHDEPHYHDFITETNYVIKGKLCLHIIDTNEDFVVEAGGIFSVPPQIKHVLKMQPDTKIIFFKDKSKNDKHVVPFEELGLEKWFMDQNF